MIKSLRWKFIRITMTAVFCVLFLIIIAVNIVNVYQSNLSLDSVTEVLMKNGGSFRKNIAGADKFKPENVNGGSELKDRFHNKAELPFSTRFFTVTTDEEGCVIRWDLSSIASVTEKDVAEFVEKVFTKKDTVGWYQTYRYRVGRTDGGYLFIFMEATNTKSTILSVLIITVLVGLTAFLAVFVLVALFSKRAIKPISETYEKQKQFITNASHELKTPLTVISANAEVISMTYGENEWCGGIERQASYMRSLINSMIQMSKLDEGEQKMSFERFNVSDAVYDTAMAFAAPAKKKGLNIDVCVTPDLYINGDEGAVRQVVSILTDNAVKYCDESGEIFVNALSVKEFGRERVIISVKNTYGAVSSLDTERIFERFYREDTARADEHSYGLGLSIARAIVAQHGGRMKAVKGERTIEMRIYFREQ